MSYSQGGLGAGGFGAACNALSLRLARRSLDGDLDFDDADYVANWLSSYMIVHGGSPHPEWPEPASAIYVAIPTLWKLYVHPSRRNEGIGPRMLTEVRRHLPPGVERIRVEHLAANRRAGSFYEREGFAVLRVVPHPTGPALAIVWRELSLA